MNWVKEKEIYIVVIIQLIIVYHLMHSYEANKQTDTDTHHSIYIYIYIYIPLHWSDKLVQSYYKSDGEREKI